MGIAISLKQYLDEHDVDYELINYPYASTSMDIAREAHVPPEKIAKCIMLEDEGGYVMAVCSASSRIQLGNLYREINRRLEFASENDLEDIFYGYGLTVVSPIGDLYVTDVVIDEDLLAESDVYFEGLNNEELIHIYADAFDSLMHDAERASFSHPM